MKTIGKMCLDQTHTKGKRGEVFGFLLDACRDTTLIILMVAATASLALGIKTEGSKKDGMMEEA
ncbi:putative P-type Ca(2+) transporter [Helianthus anomalus]